MLCKKKLLPYTRDWECGCGCRFTAPVVLSTHTTNISGEASVFCPECGKRALYGSPAMPRLVFASAGNPC